MMNTEPNKNLTDEVEDSCSETSRIDDVSEIKDEVTEEVIWNNMGIYLINNPTHTFDSTNNTITLQLVDLMAKLTGLRNGALTGYEYQLKEGQDVREIIQAVLAEVGFDNYSIEIDENDYVYIIMKNNKNYWEKSRKEKMQKTTMFKNNSRKEVLNEERIVGFDLNKSKLVVDSYG